MATYTTYDSALDAALASVDFESTRSVTKANTLIDALNALDLLTPDSASDQSSAHSFSPATRDKLRARALSFVAANVSGSRVRVLSVNTGDFR